MYSTLVDTVCGSLTLELLTGDLKAVLSLLSEVREKMGQVRETNPGSVKLV